MAFVRMTLEEAEEVGRIDRATIDSTREEDIRRHMIEDGEDPDALLPTAVCVVESPASLRAKLGLTQAEIAERLGLPVTTWRDWEQGRLGLDPAARSLLDLVAEDPDRAFRILSRTPVAAER